MVDHSTKWAALPNWSQARLAGTGIEITSLPTLDQHFVSGDLAAFGRHIGVSPEGVGALEIANGAMYSVRIARDRLLVVGIAEENLKAGWHEEGFAVTPTSAGLHVFQLSGRNSLDMVRRATTLDLASPGPSAATVFAGVLGYLYAHGSKDTIRLHADRGLASYLWSWFAAQLELSRWTTGSWQAAPVGSDSRFLAVHSDGH